MELSPFVISPGDKALLVPSSSLVYGGVMIDQDTVGSTVDTEMEIGTGTHTIRVVHVFPNIIFCHKLYLRGTQVR